MKARKIKARIPLIGIGVLGMALAIPGVASA